MQGVTNKLAVVLSFLEREETLLRDVFAKDADIEWFSLAHWRFLITLWSQTNHRATQTVAKSFFTLEGYKSDNKRRDAIKRLMNAELITAEPDPQDERKKWIVITPEAEQKIRTCLTKLGDEVEHTADKIKRLQHGSRSNAA